MRELEQIRTLALDLLAHVGRLAALSGKEHGELCVTSHSAKSSPWRRPRFPQGPMNPPAGGCRSTTVADGAISSGVATRASLGSWRMIRLWRAPWSTNVERVALALAHKGLEVESALISYEDRSPVEALSGQGLVPVIEDDGEVMVDSARILAISSDATRTRRCTPSSRRAAPRSTSSSTGSTGSGRSRRTRSRRSCRPRYPTRSAARRWRRPCATQLGRFEQLLEGREHLYGDFGAADCVAFPFLKFARGRDRADDEPFHRVLEDYQRPAAAQLPRLLAWIERVDARPRAY